MLTDPPLPAGQCASNVLVKWRLLLPASTLPPLALALTALALVPSAANLLLVAHQMPAGEESWTAERMGRLLPGLLEQSALSFFLCAFQVHESASPLPSFCSSPLPGLPTPCCPPCSAPPEAILLPLLGVMLAASSPADGARSLSHERLGWLVLWQNVAVFRCVSCFQIHPWLRHDRHDL